MLHKLARLFRRWNANAKDHPTQFRDARFGTPDAVAKAQAEYLTTLAAEEDLTIHFEEHGDITDREAKRQRAVLPPPPPKGK